MNNMKEKHEKFCKSITNVITFMHYFSEQRKENLNSEEAIMYKEVSQSSVPYNATIISLYGSIELFIDEISEEYIDTIFHIVEKYSELSPKMRDKHESVTGEYLSNPGRFLNYNLAKEDVVKNLYDCLQDNLNAKLNKKMILRHGANLKSDQIIDFFSGIGVEGVKNKILTNEIFVKGYAEKKEIGVERAREILHSTTNNNESEQSIFYELNNLVEQRNEVAHSGKVDQKSTFEYIEENTVPFILLLADVIVDILSNEIVQISIEKKKLHSFPVIYDVYNNKIILAKRGDNTLRVGDEIAFEHDGKIGRARIVSIRLNDVDVDKVGANDTQNVSFAVDKKVKKNWNYYKCTF